MRKLCAVCGRGANGPYAVIIEGQAHLVCKRDWQRLFTHTDMPLVGAFGAPHQRRGAGRPPVKADPEIVQWAAERMTSGHA